MRRALAGLLWALAFAVTVASCRGGGQVAEPGAVLLRFALVDGAPAPDELRLWIYDDGGALWSDARFPSEGALPPPKGRELGTILIQPGASTGTLRIHAVGLVGGNSALDGVLTVPATARGAGDVTLMLDTEASDDTDRDGVPDPIDDCKSVANPSQTGCGSPTDAGADGATDGGTVDAAGCGASGCQRANGQACATDGECSSGFCADGVCCANACVGPCRSCNQPNADGVCKSYPSGTDYERECGTATCNGAGACGTPPAPASKDNGSVCSASSECKSGFCTDGVCCREACTDACHSCATGSCQTLKLMEDAPSCVSPKICDVRGRCIDLASLTGNN
jgi:hypothetical protein